MKYKLYPDMILLNALIATDIKISQTHIHTGQFLGQLPVPLLFSLICSPALYIQSYILTLLIVQYTWFILQ